MIAHVDTRAMASAAGWYSTARELTVYGRSHVFGNETLVSDASKRLMQREESRISVRDTQSGRYGLGLDLEKIGERAVIGHSGGYPGHITRTWIDPEHVLVVSALTNDIDGAASPIATGVIQLIDLALTAAAERQVVPDELAVAGRFANLWGVFDVVDLGGILHTVLVRAPDLTDAATRLVVDGDRLVAAAMAGEHLEDELGRMSL